MTAPQRIWELEVWSPPGLQLHVEYGKTVLAPEMWSAGIARDMFLGLSEVPDSTDCQNLQMGLDSGALAKDAFTDFCLSHGLVGSTNDALSAARFLEFTYGRKLAWVHIPDSAAASKLAKEIHRLVAVKGFLLLDGFTEKPVFDQAT